MNEFLEKIKSRGYWKIIIHPATFEKKRIENIADLHHIIRKTFVKLPKRRREFPHFNSSIPLQEHKNWIGRESEWEVYLELWRFYQSGQFVSIKGMYEDWRDNSRIFPIPDGWRPGKYLEVTDTLLQFTEAFELAGRMMFTPVMDAQMRLKISAHNLMGRELRMDLGGREYGHLKKFTASVDEVPYVVDLPAITLLARPKELALTPAVQFFQSFGWNPGLRYLRDLRDETLLL